MCPPQERASLGLRCTEEIPRGPPSVPTPWSQPQVLVVAALAFLSRPAQALCLSHGQAVLASLFQASGVSLCALSPGSLAPHLRATLLAWVLLSTDHGPDFPVPGPGSCSWGPAWQTPRALPAAQFLKTGPWLGCLMTFLCRALWPAVPLTGPGRQPGRFTEGLQAV